MVARRPAAPESAALLPLARRDLQLRPAGRALLDGRHHDVVAEGSFVPQGVRVRVVAVRGNVVVVRPEPPPAP